MSLSYFYSLTDLSSGIIRDQWTYNAATGLGLFTGNSGANLISRSVSGDNFEDFSLFFTYDKRQSSFNTGAAFLFSNYSGRNGFSFGLDSCNFPFLRTSDDCFSFTDLNLGTKNCLCLQKSDNNFSVLRYDIPSSGLIESQSLFINPSVQLSGGPYVFGASSGEISGVNNFYGTVDQLLFVSEKVSTEAAVTIFSGFSNLSVSQSNFGTYGVSSQEWFIPNTGFNSGLQTFFSNYFTGIYQDYVLVENLDEELEYNLRINFSGVSGGYNTRNYYALNPGGFCNSGSYSQIGDVALIGSGTGLSHNFTINGNFTIGPLNTGISSYQPEEMYFTYDLSEIYEGLRYSDLWTLEIGETLVQGSNPAYFTGFEMKGVFVPNTQAVLLGTFSGNSIDIGNEAVFDSVSGVFRATNVNSGLPIYLNGERNTGFSFTGGIIDIKNYTEASSDDVIYDRVSGLELVAFSNSSSARGNYWAKTSFVATGEYSFENLFRIRESEFYETSPYHLYHGKSYQESAADPIFENLDENWT